MSEFVLRVQQDGDRTVLSVEGELDVDTVAQLQRPALSALASDDCRSLVLDLSRLAFIDSSGMGCFVALHLNAQRRTKTFMLSHVPRFAGRIFALGGLETLFRLDESEAAPNIGQTAEMATNPSAPTG